MKLTGKKIVITGGTSGIGYEMVKMLHENNSLTILSRDQEKLRNLKQLNENITTHQLNLSNAADVEKTAHMVSGEHKTIDVLINNAAVQYSPTFLDPAFSHPSILDEIAINFTAVCSLTYLLLPKLLAADKAIILNVNSGLGLTAKKSSAVYCGTKGALNIFSQSLRYQLTDTQISVLQAFLPVVDTALSEGRGKGQMSAERAAAHIIHGMERRILDHDIGKVKLLRLLLRVAPSIAKSIMKTA